MGLSVGPRVSRSPGCPAPLPAGCPTFQRCPVPRPRRRLGFSIVGPRGRGSERRGPRTHGAGVPRAPASGAFPSPPPPFSRCPLRAVARLALRSLPRGAGLQPLDPRGRPTRAPPPPPRRALVSVPPDLCRPLGLSPRGSRSPSPSPSQSAPCRPPPLPGPSLACLSLCLARGLCLCVSLPPTLAAAPRALGPRPPSPAPRPRPARPGARAPAARGAPRTPNSRHPLRFARLSPLLTRDPRPTAEAAPPTLPAPEPRAARGARPCPFPLRLTGHHTPVPTARGPGPSPGWGPRGPLLPEILPGFSSSLQERSSRSPFRESASGFFRPPHPSMGRWRGFLRAVKGLWVGEGRYPARWPRAAPLCGPLTLLKDGQLRTLHTPLPSTEVWLCWNDPHNQLGSTAPFYRQGD